MWDLCTLVKIAYKILEHRTEKATKQPMYRSVTRGISLLFSAMWGQLKGMLRSSEALHGLSLGALISVTSFPFSASLAWSHLGNMGTHTGKEF